MQPSVPYLFTSDRLGFRNWHPSDLPLMAAINANPEVMRFFPSVQSVEDTRQFINRMQRQQSLKGFCYFAVERLEDGAFIGFTGLSEATFEAPFTPCIDIGWRLDETYWSQGYATEGARRCLAYAFENLQLEAVNAIAPLVNEPSINVMKKLGMRFIETFQHPVLTQHPFLQECARYLITKAEFQSH
jgi:RimJ/RimL family protein N-acetyltransferase